ncbi:hypothetical protein B0H10DRAFT_2437139 [Mycena sp. CBHHK59/15]|nr:hypothetical protein B0H10DRAFT_2437139 [Mycena sp. CBHHK59/15]
MEFARTGPPRYVTYPLYSLSAPGSPRRVARPQPQLYRGRHTAQRAPPATGDVCPPADLIEHTPASCARHLLRPIALCCVRTPRRSASDHLSRAFSGAFKTSRTTSNPHESSKHTRLFQPTLTATTPADVRYAPSTPSFLLRHGPSVAARRLHLVLARASSSSLSSTPSWLPRTPSSPLTARPVS